MSDSLTTEKVWTELNKHLFGIIGMVTANGEARTVGVVYIVNKYKLYFGTFRQAWKTRHIEANSHVSMTIPIAKRIPFVPWVQIPAATITFAGEAEVLSNDVVSAAVMKALYRGVEKDSEQMAKSCVVEITPVGDFITYGVGMPMLQMRHPEKARGRVAVA